MICSCQSMNEILIAKNIPLTARLTAKEIWVSASGSVTLIAAQFGPNQPIPKLSVEYIDSLCSRFYYGAYAHKNAIADILLLNGFLTRSRYDTFYYALQQNLERGNILIVYSPLLLQ